MTRYSTIFLRKGGYETLYYSNEILASGEPAIAVDSGILKVGNGLDVWSDLPSVGVPSNPTAVSGASGILNMVQITQANYDLLDPDPNTIYFIV